MKKLTASHSNDSKGPTETPKSASKAASGLATARRIIGLGQFHGGPSDLATDPRYLEDFGLSRKDRPERERNQG